VREALDKALEELRIISRGLALPDLDHLDVPSLISRAIKDHTRQTGLAVTFDLDVQARTALNYAQELCVFRFLQETLSNVSRHAKVDSVQVTATATAASLEVIVTDEGYGFDPAFPREVREDGGQGLFGLIDRVESIGGQLDVTSVPNNGTTLSLTLYLEESPI
jgi:signal transduction histidine kinase